MGKPMAFLKFSCFAILFLFFIYTLSPIGNFLFSHVYMYSTGGGGVSDINSSLHFKI